MPYITLTVAMILFMVTCVIVVTIFADDSEGKYNLQSTSFIGSPRSVTYSVVSDRLCGVTLDGWPVIAVDHEVIDVSMEFYSEEDRLPMMEEVLFPIEPRKRKPASMSRCKWDRAWDEDDYEVTLSRRLRKAHPARPHKAHK